MCPICTPVKLAAPIFAVLANGMQIVTRTLIILAGATLFACATPPQRTVPAPVEEIVAVGSVSQSADYYLNQADGASGDSQTAYRLLAARALLESGDMAGAQLQLQLVQPMLKQAAHINEAALLGASLELSAGKPATAMALLRSVDESQLSSPARIEYLQRLSDTYAADGNPVESARALQQLSEQLDEPARSEIYAQLWERLTPLTSFTLQLFEQAPAPDTFTGWLRLAALSKEAATDPDRLRHEVERWRAEFPEHPANQQMPGTLDTALHTVPYAPARIAVLLPLSGSFELQGHAIRDGIVAAYLAAGSQTPVSFYDTANGAEKAYAQAQAEQAEFVIGPLLKPQISRLIDAQLIDRPTLLLNQQDDLPQLEHLYQFALSPEAEAAQAAVKMWQDGVKKPLVLVPTNNTGSRIEQAFSAAWQQLDSELEPEFSRYADRKTMQQVLRNAVGVTASNARIRQLKSVIGTSVETEPRSRRDVDGIYLFASAVDLRLLKPSLDVSVSPIAPSIPVYASSRGHELSGEPPRELNGVTFSELPLMLKQDNGESSELMQMNRAIWPQRAATEIRLFGLGYDSYNIIIHLAQLQVFPDYRIAGQTGQLGVNAQGVLVQELDWAQYQGNQIVRIATHVTPVEQQP